MTAVVARLDAARRAQREEERRVRALLRREQNEAHRTAKMGRPGPTVETARKLKPHGIETLLDRGVIGQAEADMLDQIARAYTLITSGTGVRLSSLERVDGGRLPADALPGEVRLLRHYAAWWDLLCRSRLQRSLPILIDIAVDGASLNDLAKARRMDKRTVKRLLVEGLACWAEAGRPGGARFR